jgi:uncharacterized membrane protein YdjX (TVP38/TMEM64 family)
MDKMDTNRKKFKPTEQLNLIGGGVVLLALVAVAFFVDIKSLQEFIEKAGVWGPLAFIVIKASTIVIAPLSGAPLYPIVGLIFGFWPGILYVALGDFLGYTIAFSISRIFGRRIVLKFLSEREEGVLSRVIEHVGSGKGFFHACLTLFGMPEALAYGAGLSSIKYSKFISILMPLSIFAASILVFFGSILEPEGESILLSLALPLLAGVAIIVGGTLFIKGVRKKEERNKKNEEVRENF